MSSPTSPLEQGSRAEPCACLIKGIPTMIVTPAEDTISPPDEQKAVCGLIGEPKEFDLLAGRGHMDIINGDGAEKVLQRQFDFIKKQFGFIKRQFDF